MYEQEDLFNPHVAGLFECFLLAIFAIWEKIIFSLSEQYHIQVSDLYLRF